MSEVLSVQLNTSRVCSRKRCHRDDIEIVGPRSQRGILGSVDWSIREGAPARAGVDRGIREFSPTAGIAADQSSLGTFGSDSRIPRRPHDPGLVTDICFSAVPDLVELLAIDRRNLELFVCDLLV